MPDRFLPIQPSTSPEQQLVMINRNFAVLDAETSTKLYYDENGIPSISIGIQQDRTSRIRISKPGVDVTTATDSQLAFNSSQNVFKIVSTGTATLPVGGVVDGGVGVWNNNSGSVNVAHGLSYIPIVIAELQLGSTYIPMPYTSVSNPSSSSAAWVNYTALTDATNVSFQSFTMGLHTAVTAGNVTVKYYLLQESAN